MTNVLVEVEKNINFVTAIKNLFYVQKHSIIKHLEFFLASTSVLS